MASKHFKVGPLLELLQIASYDRECQVGTGNTKEQKMLSSPTPWLQEKYNQQNFMKLVSGIPLGVSCMPS